MKTRILVAIIVLIVSFLFAEEILRDFRPKAVFVPDAKTAIAIAVDVWSPIHGEEQIQKQKPFKASLKKSVWHVEGTLPEGYLGGVVVAEISKRDGRIVGVGHGE